MDFAADLLWEFLNNKHHANNVGMLLAVYWKPLETAETTESVTSKHFELIYFRLR